MTRASDDAGGHDDQEPPGPGGGQVDALRHLRAGEVRRAGDDRLGLGALLIVAICGPLRGQPLGQPVVDLGGAAAPPGTRDRDGKPASAPGLLRVRRTLRLVAHRDRLYTPAAAHAQCQPVRRDRVRPASSPAAAST